jgi:hypothetical protein
MIYQELPSSNLMSSVTYYRHSKVRDVSKVKVSRFILGSKLLMLKNWRLTITTLSLSRTIYSVHTKFQRFSRISKQTYKLLQIESIPNYPSYVTSIECSSNISTAKACLRADIDGLFILISKLFEHRSCRNQSQIYLMQEKEREIE